MNSTYPHASPTWARRPNDLRPHTVYELWAGTECIYVGMTVNLRGRLADHRRYRNGWPRVTEIRTTEVSCRNSAAGLEERLIFLLRPSENSRWNPDYDKSLLTRRGFRVLLDAASP